eukprot:CAMPEP_0197178132 /NCGR_PEP_ID=MMETSP1423-20130617/3504_1 /TAXON_ID=476441 /ORGANISM="Pseudo-nitzschia heimii, Strain UNC1101" /LENGTH=652 /DNA_ID=CAMNT_0042627807 /DNA_START=219 /DNA_END=2177 /DNA_ORIENTATION=+
MIGIISKLLHFLILLVHFEGSNGFQSTRSSRHGAVASSSKLFVTTASNSVSTDNGSTDESIPSKIDVDFKAYANGYKTVFSEIPYADCKPSFGSIPPDLKGSYFRAGPAMFSAGSIAPPKTSIIQPREGGPVPDGQTPKRMVKHPYDADGGVLGVTFSGNETATTRFRYVRTIAFTNERRKGQRLYTGMDSTRELGHDIAQGLGNDLHTPMFRHHLQPGLNKKRKNISNTRVIYWGKRLLSMWEGGQPYKLDGLALSTEGRSQLGGVLEEQDPFGSSMVIDPVEDRALMYRVRQDSKNSEVTVFEFKNDFRVVDEGEIDEKGQSSLLLPGLAIFSDMAVTENFALFVQPAVSTTMQFVFTKEPGKVVSVENESATMHLVPRVGTNKEPISIEIPFDGVIEANLQYCNAYEDGNKIVVDAIRSDGSEKPPASAASMKWPFVSSRSDYEAKSANRSLWRYEIDTESKLVTKKKLSDIQCYFGSVQPNQKTRKHDCIFMAIGGLGDETAPPQGIAKYDCNSGSFDSWLPEAHEFCGEPMFAPKVNPASQDDGYILTVLFDGKNEKSELLVFESIAISAGPVCRIPLGIGIPHGLHGCFTTSEEATWSFEEIQRRSKLADKIESQGDRWNEVKSDFSGLGLRFDDMEEYFGDSFLS